MQPYSQKVREDAVTFARKLVERKPVYLDTETTGLSPKDEIVEIAVVDHDGTVLFDELVKPSIKIPREASKIHHISDEMVEKKRPWPILWTELRRILTGRVIGIYNAEFDLRMMVQSYKAYNLTWKENLSSEDILKLYARFYGEFDSYRGSYRYQSLANAGKQCGLTLPNSHRAKDDAMLARALLHYMAEG